MYNCGYGYLTITIRKYNIKLLAFANNFILFREVFL